VAALSARGLLDQVRDTRDRRTRRLSATRAGRDIHDDVAPRALEVEAQLLASLTVPEAMALRLALAKLREACLKP
jgi:DNA-binding MarR family transcriptional regulator